MAVYEEEIAQNAEELEAFIDILVREGVRSYLEVGSKYGGSLWAIGSRLPVGSRIVSVDMPGGTKAWQKSRLSLIDCVARLNLRGQKASIIWGDSTDPETIAQVRKLGPFDAIFVDANHTLSYLQRDWDNYSTLGRIVAFHDISWRRAPTWVGTRIDAMEFWQYLKDQGYEHQEVRLCPTGKNNGIGIVFREDS